MLTESPQWTFASKRPLTQWYGHVQLLSTHVLGQWFCLDRESGERKWQRRMFRPNTIDGVESGVIVAIEMRADGPWTAAFGCYGISLENGGYLWISHGEGVWGRFVRLLDFFPGFTNELRDTPHHVSDGKVFCSSGRVLDIQSGRLLDRMDPELVRAYETARTPEDDFHRSHFEQQHQKVRIADGLVLQYAGAGPGYKWGVLDIAAETETGRPLWRFSNNQLDRHVAQYRLALPFLYLVVSDEPEDKPHPTKKHYVLPNPTLWHLLAIDLWTGSIVQDFPLDHRKLAKCRIEDVDDTGLLIGKSCRELVYFRRHR